MIEISHCLTSLTAERDVTRTAIGDGGPVPTSSRSPAANSRDPGCANLIGTALSPARLCTGSSTGCALPGACGAVIPREVSMCVARLAGRRHRSARSIRGIGAMLRSALSRNGTRLSIGRTGKRWYPFAARSGTRSALELVSGRWPGRRYGERTPVRDHSGRMTSRRGNIMPALIIRAAVTAAGAAALLGIGTAPAWAWPIPITPEQQNFINAARGAGFPGDDDAVLQAGLQACQMLMTGKGTQGATEFVAGQYGADPAQAGALVRAAHGRLCTSARG